MSERYRRQRSSPFVGPIVVVTIIAVIAAWGVFGEKVQSWIVGAGSVIAQDPPAQLPPVTSQESPVTKPEIVPPAGGEQAVSVVAADLAGMLVHREETREPRYKRDYFGGRWIDADGNGCNTRYEVLIEESTTPVTVSSGCWIDGGTWVSAMDGAYATTPREIEIDHHVPLAEAWRSGASAWTDERRLAFANDLGVPYALNGSSTMSNQSKGDKDPAKWMPTNDAHRCEYVITWALMKYRWALAADAAEIDALAREMSGSCGETVVSLPEVVSG